MNSNPGTPQKAKVGRPPTKKDSPSSGISSSADFASQLPAHIRKPMQDLVQELKAGRLSSQDFYTRARELLGEPLYSRLMQNMKQNSVGRMQPPAPSMQQIVQPPLPPTNTIVFGGATSDKNIDSAALQDVMQYAGVDLKAEAEMILREQQQGVFSASAYSGMAGLEDPRMDPSFFFNSARLKAIMMQAGRQYGLEATSDAVEALAKVILRRLSGLMCKLVKYSRHRSDLARRHYKIKVENDPRKQIWLLEQMLCQTPTSNSSNNNNNVHKKEAESNQNDDGEEGSGEAKKKRKIAPDETAIKTKLTNLTASAASGLKLKSWMTSSTASLDEPVGAGSSTPANKEDKTGAGIPEECKRMNLSQAPSASPLTERDLIERYLGRSVSVKDLIRVLEEESGNGRRSMILHHLYHYQ